MLKIEWLVENEQRKIIGYPRNGDHSAELKKEKVIWPPISDMQKAKNKVHTNHLQIVS